MNVNPFSGYGQAHRYLSYILKTKDKEIEYRWTHRNVPLLSWIYKKVNLHDKFTWIYHVKICHFRWKSPKLYSPSICSVETIHSWLTYCLQRKKMRKKYSRNSSFPNIIVSGKHLFNVLKCKWIIINDPWNVTYTVKRPPAYNVTLSKSSTFSEFPFMIIQIKIQWFNYKIIF